MSYYFDSIMMWLQSHQSILGWAGFISVCMMAATLLLVPLIIVRLPSRYLIEEDDGLARIPAPWRGPYLIVKNALGITLLLVGVAMLILPGQGLLTLLIGLALLNFPGKANMIRRLIGRHRILEVINRLRVRANKEPLAAPKDDSGD